MTGKISKRNYNKKSKRRTKRRYTKRRRYTKKKIRRYTKKKMRGGNGEMAKACLGAVAEAKGMTMDELQTLLQPAGGAELLDELFTDTGLTEVVPKFEAVARGPAVVHRRNPPKATSARCPECGVSGGHIHGCWRSSPILPAR